MTSENYDALESLLRTLERDIVPGACMDHLEVDSLKVPIKITPLPGNELTLHTGPWRGLKEVHIRYDCVSFWTYEGMFVEARISRSPTRLAEIIRTIWVAIDPSNVDAGTIWAKVKGS